MTSQSRVGRFLSNLRNSLRDRRGEADYLLPKQPYECSLETPPTGSSLNSSPDINALARALPSPSGAESTPYSWQLARALLRLRTHPAGSYCVSGVPFSQWPRKRIPTLGASGTSCRVQEMFTVVLPGSTRLFVKVVPHAVWLAQWKGEETWDGEYTTDGENFVMEAAALAFLQEYAPGIAPALNAVLEISGTAASRPPSSRPKHIRRADEGVTHIAIVSEVYGEDMLDYLDRRDRINRPLNNEEKHALQVSCIFLLQKLHAAGLAHLDFTPENILIGPGGLRLCDFAKATPLHSRRLRHIPVLLRGGREPLVPEVFPFESCEPTVGKGAYMPPECWQIYWRLEAQQIMKPLVDLAPLKDAAQRVTYYFRVAAADLYMSGVVLFWIWSDGGVWKCSDPRQDEKYYHLVRSKLDLEIFRECRAWPVALKSCLTKMLDPDPWQRATLDEVLETDWIAQHAREAAPSEARAVAAREKFL